MKKFWLVLLSLGLIVAFSASAFAVDVKVSGEYYAAGLYLSKTSVNDGWYDENNENPSTAFFYQRLRVGTDFIVSPCLKLVTRFDAMERIWGGARSNNWAVNQGGYYPMSAETQYENENIAFDVAYIDYTSPIGTFQVGYMPDSTWGTVFGNDSTGPTVGLIKWSAPVGPVTLMANFAKLGDRSYSSVTSNYSGPDPVQLNASRTDRDTDSYRAGFIVPIKGEKVSGNTGALFIYTRDADSRGRATGPWMTKTWQIIPYFKGNIGPVALQAEVKYQFGDYKEYEYNTGNDDVKIDSLSVFLDANVKLGMVTVGGSFAYLQGDDNVDDDVKHDANTGGLDWNPCLIMFNYDTINYWVGGIDGHTNSQVGGPMSNAWFFQGRVGVSPTTQLDVNMSVSYAMADKKPAPWNPDHAFANGTYGTEIDITGTYKITNNLSYMLGAGYLFTGDYFKGFDRERQDYKIVDDFILINKLTLSF